MHAPRQHASVLGDTTNSELVAHFRLQTYKWVREHTAAQSSFILYCKSSLVLPARQLSSARCAPKVVWCESALLDSSLSCGVLASANSA